MKAASYNVENHLKAGVAHSQSNERHHDPVLASLKYGEWLFDQIGPHFKNALASSLNRKDSSETLNLTELSASRYRSGPTPSSLKRAASLEIVMAPSPEEYGFWTRALATVVPDGKLSSHSAADSLDIRKGCNLISETLPVWYEAISKWIHFLCVFQHSDCYAGSHPHLFGTLFVKANANKKEMAISIVHEFAHQEVFLLNVIDRLVTPEFDNHLVYSALPQKGIPPIGRFHAAHALYRTIYFEKMISAESLEKNIQLFRDTLNSFEEGELSPFGSRIVNEVYRPVFF